MKKLILCLILAGCAPQPPVVFEAAPRPCTVTALANGALLSCPDGTEAFIENGADGTNGADGINGSSCTALATAEGALIQCSDGSQVLIKYKEKK